jgi:hypothetical protein
LYVPVLAYSPGTAIGDTPELAGPTCTVSYPLELDVDDELEDDSSGVVPCRVRK